MASVEAILAITAYFQNDRAAALEHAAAAVPTIPPGDTGWNSFAVLSIFASERRAEVLADLRAKRAIVRSLHGAELPTSIRW